MPIRFIRNAHFLRATYVGIITAQDIIILMLEIAAAETIYSRTPNRLNDYTQVITFDLSFYDIFGLAQRRKAEVFANQARSALVAKEPVQLGFARMFQVLFEHPQITIRIFSDLAEAEAWLNE